MNAAVVTGSQHATDAARSILALGGNAVDAGVAAAWALGVCEPSGSGLGGQCVMLIGTPDGALRVIDGHSNAPAGASVETVSAAEQRSGRRATTVPSFPAAVELARARYGSMPLALVLEPAVALARDGYPVGRFQHRDTRWCAAALATDEAAGAIFLRDGTAPALGETFRQPALARTLEHLARRGVEDFYRGEVAREIAADHAERGGLVRLCDLARYAPREREVYRGTYRELTLVTSPAPSGGPQLVRAAELFERLADPAFTGRRQDTALALAVHGAFDEREQPPAILAGARGGEPPGETTHLCVADRDGTVVTLTSSIQSLFGAKVANAGLGFVYNNYLRTMPRTAHPHRLRPGAVPRSNACPTIVLRRDAPLLALGGAGSRRIVSATLQVLSAVVDRGLDLATAVAEPRVHATLDGAAWIERPAATDEAVGELARHFNQIVVRPPHSWAMGCVNALSFDRDEVASAADPRRDGAAWAA